MSQWETEGPGPNAEMDAVEVKDTEPPSCYVENAGQISHEEPLIQTPCTSNREIKDRGELTLFVFWLFFAFMDRRVKMDRIEGFAG